MAKTLPPETFDTIKSRPHGKEIPNTPSLRQISSLLKKMLRGLHVLFSFRYGQEKTRVVAKND